MDYIITGNKAGTTTLLVHGVYNPIDNTPGSSDYYIALHNTKKPGDVLINETVVVHVTE